MRWLAGLVLLALVGCVEGCGQENDSRTFNMVVYHQTQEEMEALMGEDVAGWAKWWDDGTCEIWTRWPEEYQGRCIRITGGWTACDEDFYQWVLGHEIRHCLEGTFHDPS